MKSKQSDGKNYSRQLGILEVSFPGGKFVDGKIKAEPGYYIDLDYKNGGGVLRKKDSSGPGVVIEPCDCSLEGDGVCAQASSTFPNGDISEVWCVDEGCGFCVGGVTPEAGLNFPLKVVFGEIAI